MNRVVLFAEVPSFYASVERSDDPALEERPLIVGGDPRKRGLVQDASPDARAAGVTLEMPVLEAMRLCPQARAVRTNMNRYREVSRRLFTALRRVFDELEPFGLGAAYLDLTTAARRADGIAERLCAAARDELGFALRIGVASGKFLARLAAEEAEPGEVRRLAPDEESDFLRSLPVGRLEGVGDKTSARLAELGATRIGEIVGLGRERLEAALGTHGARIFDLARGIDDRPVRSVARPQSLSRESTLGEARDLGVVRAQLLDLAQQLETELRSQGLAARRIALKIRFQDRSATTRSRTLSSAVSTAGAIHRVVEGLLGRTEAGSRPARGIGIQLGRLCPAEGDRQLDLFPP